MSRRSPIVLLLLILLAALAISVINGLWLAQRHERLDFVEAETCDATRSLDPRPQSHEPGMQWSYMLCNTTDGQHDPNQAVQRDGVSVLDHDIMDGERFKLRPQKSWNLNCDYGETVLCHPAGQADEMGNYALALAPGEFAIRLESAKNTHPGQTGLLLLTLILLVSGLIYGAKNVDAMPKPPLKIADGILAYVVSLIVAVGLSGAAAAAFKIEGYLVPKQAILLSNLAMFVALFGTAGTWLLWRTKKGIDGKISDENTTVKAGSPNELTHTTSDWKLSIHPMILAPLTGFALAILAALTLFFQFNDVTMTTHDLANELPGYSLALAHFAMLAAISEELLFRGLIQTAIGGRNATGLRAWIGIAVATTAFTLVHVPQSEGHLFTLLPVAMLGCFSGIVRQKTHAIFPSMTMHLTYNSVLLLPAFFA